MQENNSIKVWNNGDGVPVEIHKEEQVYVPELIFGHLLTSSNYNDSQKKVCGVCSLRTSQQSTKNVDRLQCKGVLMSSGYVPPSALLHSDFQINPDIQAGNNK